MSTTSLPWINEILWAMISSELPNGRLMRRFNPFSGFASRVVKFLRNFTHKRWRVLEGEAANATVYGGGKKAICLRQLGGKELTNTFGGSTRLFPSQRLSQIR